MTKQEKLYKFVAGFIKKHKIACSESIFQCDDLQLGAPEFIDECVKIVGYHDPDAPEEKIDPPKKEKRHPNLRNIYEDFATVYISEFMEMMVTGCTGGLYGDTIEENAGKFTADDVRKFIRFQHGDNDYTYSFSTPDDDALQNNITETCSAFLKLVETDWGDKRGKDFYTKQCPDLISNAIDSFNKIINDINEP
jgi:hypothetical protein